jgi:hypothetical protein
LQRDASVAFGVPYGKEPTYEDLLDAARTSAGLGLAKDGDEDPIASATRLFEQYKKIDRTWWSPLELSSHIFYFDRAEKKVFEGLAALNIEVPATLPPVGSLPTFQVNAQALHVPRAIGKYVIVFETGFLSFTSALSRISSGVLLGRGGVGIGGQFIDLMFNQIVLGTSAHLHPETLAIDRDTWMRGEVTLRPIFEAFLMAHEYAHVVLGHYAAVQDASTHSRAELETQADRLAFRIIVGAYRDPVQVLIAVGALLHAHRLFERGYELMGEDELGAMSGASHPGAVDRSQNLLNSARREMSPAELNEAIYWLGVHAEMMKQWWAPLESALPTAREQFPKGWVPNDPSEERDALGRFVRLVGSHVQVEREGLPGSKRRTGLQRWRRGMRR